MNTDLIARLLDKTRGWHPDQVEAASALEAADARIAELERTETLYEELRKAIDGGSESMTHKDAVQDVEALRERVKALEDERDARRNEAITGRDELLMNIAAHNGERT